MIQILVILFEVVSDRIEEVMQIIDGHPRLPLTIFRAKYEMLVPFSVPYWGRSEAIFWQDSCCQVNFLQLPTELIQELRARWLMMIIVVIIIMFPTLQCLDPWEFAVRLSQQRCALSAYLPSAVHCTTCGGSVVLIIKLNFENKKSGTQ